jgi:hypothetical protein
VTETEGECDVQLNRYDKAGYSETTNSLPSEKGVGLRMPIKTFEVNTIVDQLTPIQLAGCETNDIGKSKSKRIARSGRLQLLMPESTLDRLEAIKEATGAASYAEVVRRSLRIYEALLAEQRDGSTLIVRRVDGTELVVPNNLLFI